MSEDIAYPSVTPPTAADLVADVTMDFDSAVVQAFVVAHTDDAMTAREKAVALFSAVRDQIRYTPYRVTIGEEFVSASYTLGAGEAYCIPKALLYAATLRAVGIPARLGVADVINHLSSSKLDAMLQSEEFVAHGYTALWLDERWIRATPTFNTELCARMGVDVLEFDGENDALFPAFDQSGQRHMQYLRYHGEFSAFDPEFVLSLWSNAYPHWVEAGVDFYKENDFSAGAAF